MSDARQRDWAPILHIGVGMGFFVGLGAARSFGLFDFGASGNMSLLLFPALIFVIGQPRGRRGWLVAALAALFVIAVVGAGVPVLRWMAGGGTRFELLVNLAGAVIGISGIAAARHQSDPDPKHSPTHPKAWKPITRWGLLSGLALGSAVFAAALIFWSRWVDAHVEIAGVGTAIAFLQAFLAGIVAAMTVTYCRPSDRRSTLFSALAGLALAGLTEACILGGMALIQALAADRTILAAMRDTLVFSAALVIPATYAAAWLLGRRPVAPPKADGGTP